MFKALQNGYELPNKITKEQYNYIKNHKDENPALTGFVGFGCSFGGKFFGGYARDKMETNYALTSKRSLLKMSKFLNKVKFSIIQEPQNKDTKGVSSVRLLFIILETGLAIRLLPPKYLNCKSPILYNTPICHNLIQIS